MLAASQPRPSTWYPGRSSSAYARYVAEMEGRMARATFLWRAVGGREGLPPALLPPPDSIVIPNLDTLLDTLPTDSLP